MVERLPSLGLLLELVQAERDKQLVHFDALDTKAGIVLAFSGLLITLAPDVPAVFRMLGVVAASASAALSLWAFWPRRFPVLEPSPLRSYLRAEMELTRLTVLDTLEDFVNEGSLVLQGKGRRLSWAFSALVVTGGLFAAGILTSSL